MRKIIFLLGGLLLSSLAINAQIISKSNAALLHSQEKNNGTARFNAMGGAFGALGGDLSAGDINPAGLAVFNNSQAVITFGLRNTDINTSFYGTNTKSANGYFNMSQAGGVLVFDGNTRSNWRKVALGINYTLANDYENNYTINGNSGEADFMNDPYLNNITYPNVVGQYLGNVTTGENNKLTLSLAAQYNNNLYVGFSIVTHSIEYLHNSLFEESNNDAANINELDASVLQKLYTYGDGIGINIGFIAKPTQEIRLGASYQSPTWYSLTDDYLEDIEIKVSNNNEIFKSDQVKEINDYNLSTPSKLTGSFAYVFGKEGLFSVDYTYKNYTGVTLNTSADFETNFTSENTFFSNNLKNTSSLKLGTEWRIDNFSLRGGYFFEESPFINALDTDHLKGYSLGLGFKFSRNVKLDLAYQNTKNTEPNEFINIKDNNNQNIVNPAEINITHNKFTATLVIGL